MKGGATMRKVNAVSKTSVVLNVVALFGIMLMMLTMTYCWIESSSSLNVTGVNLNTQSLQGTKIGIGDGDSYNSTVDLGKYFDETSGFMLAPVSSADAEAFYFPVSDSYYRQGTSSDKNVSYVTMEFYLTADTDDTDFWFDAVPTFTASKDSNTVTNVQKAFRVAVTVDGTTSIYSNDGAATQAVINTSGGTATQNCRRFSDYVYSKANSENKIISIASKTTKKIQITLWLENKDENYIKSDFAGSSVSVKMKLASSWSKKDSVSFIDMTNDALTEHWTINDDATMWVTNKTTGSHYQMTYNDSTKTWTAVDVPVGAKNLIFYRCAGAYDTSGDISTAYNGIKCWNYWLTNSRLSSKTDTYIAYGDKKSVSEPMGFGMWGTSVEDELTQITMNDSYTDLAGSNNVTVTNKSYSDQAYVMRRTSEHTWSTYVPKDTSKINFSSANFSCGANDEKQPTDSTYTLTGSKTGTWGAVTFSTISAVDSSKNHNLIASGTLKLVNADDTNVYVDMTYDSSTYTWTANNVLSNITNINFVYTPNSGGSPITWNAGDKGNETAYYIVSNSIGQWGSAPENIQWYVSGLGSGDIEMTEINASNTVAYNLITNSNGDVTFKIKSSDGDFYGSNTAITDITSLQTLSAGTGNITLKTSYRSGGQFRLLFNTVTCQLSVWRVPLAVEDDKSRVYIGIPASWGDSWLQEVNHWEATNGFVSVSDKQIIKNYDYSDVKYNMYYADLYNTARNLQWVNANRANYFPSNGLAITPATGKVYFLLSDNSAEVGKTSTGNILDKQTAPTSVLASGSTNKAISLGQSVQLSASGQNRGSLYGCGLASSNITYYLEDGTWIDSMWTPAVTGSYKIYAKADDGYIASDRSTAYAVVTVS